MTFELSLLLGLPFGIFVSLLAFGRKLPRQGDWLAVACMAVCTALAGVLAYRTAFLHEHLNASLPWIALGSGRVLSFSIHLDATAGLLAFVVSLVTLLVMIFSVEYMHGEKHYTRYFAYLCLFSGAMLGLVLSGNLVWMYAFWELVGLASYLLIGFWQHKPEAARASKKAFLINRIGDVGFLVAILTLFSLAPSLDLKALAIWMASEQAIEAPYTLLLLASCGLALAAAGKSGQLPFSIWLPDAMEGPTPVSALLHAATMVAAGVYLLLRVHFLLPEEVLTGIAILGAVTAFVAAFAALSQTDLKKVLAYSTISQLGYMFMGIGVGAYQAALAHLLTHAFFKAALFLSAGAIIHALRHAAHHANLHHFDAQDLRQMGGLRKQLPFTFIAFALAAAVLAGLPLFSGFLSKDAILLGAWEWASERGSFAWLLPIIGLTSALLTAFYAGRLLFKVFLGARHLPEAMNVHESGFSIKMPLAVLSLGAGWFLFGSSPLSLGHAWATVLRPLHEGEAHTLVALCSAALGALGVGLAYLKYGKGQLTGFSLGASHPMYKLSLHFFYLDEIYQWCITRLLLPLANRTAQFDREILDGMVNVWAKTMAIMAFLVASFDKYVVDGLVRGLGASAIFSGRLVIGTVQQGQVQNYLIWAVIGLLLMLWAGL